MKLKVASNTFGTHTHQLFCGLNILKERGYIDLRYVAPPRWFRKRTTRQSVYLEFYPENEEKISCFYDFNDSSKIADFIALGECDFYYKRSFSKNGYPDVVNNEKIFPLGFNYQVNSGSIKDIFCRAVGDFICYPYNPMKSYGRSQLSEVLRFGRDMVWRSYRRREVVSSEEISFPPKFFYDRKSILFQCRLWDTAYFPKSDMDHIDFLNSSRIKVVTQLKKEFGNLYIGGLQDNSFARKVAPHLIVKAPTNRKNYLDLVRTSAVAITTNGISDSIGWKMGEFVSLSKVIVCEPLKHTLPGGFQEGKHYSEFNDEFECVEKCLKLLNNPSLANDFSENCFNYYNRYLRPDMLVLNTLINSKMNKLLSI